MVQAGRSQVRVSIRWLIFFNFPNPFSRTMALGFNQPLTEYISGGKARPAREADTLMAIYEPTF
jgi:hypothetical protein